MRFIVPIAILAVVVTLVACPAAEEDPGRGVRETVEQEHAFVRAGEYDKVWTLYSIEFKEKIEAGFAEQKRGIRREMAKRSYDVDKWAIEQTGMTGEQYLEASAREILAATLKVRRDDALRTKIVGKIVIENEIAHVLMVLPPTEDPAEFKFIHRNGRWLYHDRSFMPAK